MRSQRPVLLLVLVLVLVLLGVVSAGQHDKYSGYSVHRVHVASRVEADSLLAILEESGAELWRAAAAGGEALVLVSPQSQTALDALREHSFQPELVVADVAKDLEEFDSKLSAHRAQRARLGRLVPFEDYPRYAEIDAYMERIAAEYPDLVTLVNAGRSTEGRDIKYLKISSSNFSDTSKPVYMLDAMIHAREWVTTPVALYSVHRLVEELRSEDADLLRDVDWIVMPMVNPDGYEFSHTDTRLWRRTRSFNEEVSTTCFGADGNRNFNVSWNTVGVSNNPCSDVYPGSAPFSEPETRIVRDVLLEHLSRMQLYLNIHSYGNWVLFGYGDHSLPPNALLLHHVGAAMGAAMDTVRLPEADFYKVGNSASLLYGTSGSAQDYAQFIGVPFSYTLELPGYRYWFQVPPEYIEHINEETWRGIAISARLAKQHYDARINTN